VCSSDLEVTVTQYNNNTYIPFLVPTMRDAVSLLAGDGTGIKSLPNEAQIQAPNFSNFAPVPVKAVISGLQTGVDTIGLEVAETLGLKTGGNGTPGFATEVGYAKDLAERFGVREIDAEKQSRAKSSKEFYLPRTEENAKNSDGTVYFSTALDSAGLIATKRYATMYKKPFLVNPNPQQLREWLIANNIQTLNVAGNRGSKLTSQQAMNIRNILLQALTNKQSEATISFNENPGEVVNVWYSSGENGELSNLARRPFMYQGKEFASVEHAYQSLKSGSFNEKAYNRPNDFVGKKKNAPRITMTEDNWNLKLMKSLMLESFKGNPEASQKLLATGSATITHKQGDAIWAEHFPRIIMEVRDELKIEPQLNTPEQILAQAKDNGEITNKCD